MVSETKTRVGDQNRKRWRLDPNINYTCQIYLGKKLISKARGLSKKKAEEKAAKIAVSVLKPYKINRDE